MASILLIAFTLAVAVIIGSWLTSMASQETSSVGETINETITCSKGVIDIVSIPNNTGVVIQNMGQINLTGDFTYTCGPNITTSTSVNLDEGKIILLNTHSNISCQKSGNKIRVSSHTCPNVYAECTYGSNCP